MNKLLIVGLGNYPKQYENTRHNVGFRVVDELAKILNVSINNAKFNGLFGSVNIGDKTIILAKPLTLMNLSGEFVQPLVNFFKISLDDIVVICDDVDTEFGKFRMRKKGSSGGQNGLKNIINHLGTENFKRIRVGIGKPTGQMSMVDHVLSKFSQQEQEILGKTIQKIENLLVEWVKGVDFDALISKAANSI